MYEVSEDFLNTVTSNTRQYRWSGTIKTNTGNIIEFTNDDIVKGSGYINRKCCENSEIELGTVYAAELGISLFLDIDRYTLYDGLVTLNYELLIGDTFETVPLGIFTITEATRKLKTVTIKAYDFMLKFDQTLMINTTSGTPYDFLHLCCDSCGVELGHLQKEIEGMPNGTETLGIYPDNDIDTYRDLLFYVAQAVGRFAQIDRFGKLVLVSYGTESVLDVPNTQRFSSSFSDFITRYTAISATDVQTQISEYLSVKPDDALTMNIGINPLLQYGTAEAKKARFEAILNAITPISYVPFESETIGNPALDIGDIITFSGGQADGHITAITSIDIKINGKTTIKCVGSNPRLAQAKSKTDKNIAGIMKSSTSNENTVKVFTNTKKLVVKDEDVEIVSLEFASTTSTALLFQGQVLLDVEANEVAGSKEMTRSTDDGEVTEVFNYKEDGLAIGKVTYFINDFEVTQFVPLESWHSGRHILDLYYPVDNVDENTLTRIKVFLNISDGQATIDKQWIIASLLGQGQAMETPWDGTINVTEDFDLLSEENTSDMIPFRSVAGAFTQYPYLGAANDDIDLFSVTSQKDLLGLYDHATMGVIVTGFTLNTKPSYQGDYDQRYVRITSNNEYMLVSEYKFIAHEETIDYGNLSALEIITDDKDYIESLEVQDEQL